MHTPCYACISASTWEHNSSHHSPLQLLYIDIGAYFDTVRACLLLLYLFFHQVRDKGEGGGGGERTTIGRWWKIPLYKVKAESRWSRHILALTYSE